MVGTLLSTSFTAGVDIRTVAGRLGHAGGGSTTLKAYTAWVSEADQRAAKTISGRMPPLPTQPDPVDRAKTDPHSPYQRIAARLRHDILTGTLTDGDHPPSAKHLATQHNVSPATAHRALTLLKTWGLITSSHSQRATVTRPAQPEPQPHDTHTATSQPADTDTDAGRELLHLDVRWRGTTIKKLTTEANPTNPTELRRPLTDAIRRHGHDESHIGDYEMDIRDPGTHHLLTTFVTTTPPAEPRGFTP
ncbi:MAG: GntR family transcriptional regulator [Pseudonocardiaceae bacterium]